MAFQSIPQSSFAGSLGRGVGQGLSEQLPKEIERIRLSQGLKNLGADTANLSPLEQVSKLAAIPGMNMQNIGAFLPYLQQLQGRKALEQKAGMASKVPEGQKQEVAKEPSYRDRMESQDFLVPKNEQQIYQRANELAKLNPNITEQEAISQAQSEDARRIQADTALESKRNLIQNEVNSAAETWLQKQGNQQFGDIIGELKSDYIDKAINKSLAKGVSPYQAGKEAARDMLDFAKTRGQLRTNRAAIFAGGKSGDKVLKDIKNARSEYEKRGQLENLRNDLINYHDLSPEEADSIAFPVSKGEKSYIDSFPKTLKSKLGMRSTKELSEDQIDGIIKRMTNEDSVKSIALDLMERGYSGSAFIEQMKERKDDLTPRQARDLTTFSERPTLGDIQLFGFKKLVNQWRLKQ